MSPAGRYFLEHVVILSNGEFAGYSMRRLLTQILDKYGLFGWYHCRKLESESN